VSVVGAFKFAGNALAPVVWLPLYDLHAWLAFACAGAGVAGALFALHMQFVNVESFTLEQSVLVMAMVIVGGTGTLLGPLVGAVLLLSLPAGLAFLPFIPATEVGAVQQIIYGLAMTLLMVFRPAGLVGDLSRGKATA
jgi:branched-chain amino acid transport system permease protein